MMNMAPTIRAHQGNGFSKVGDTNGHSDNILADAFADLGGAFDAFNSKVSDVYSNEMREICLQLIDLRDSCVLSEEDFSKVISLLLIGQMSAEVSSMVHGQVGRQLDGLLTAAGK